MLVVVIATKVFHSTYHALGWCYQQTIQLNVLVVILQLLVHKVRCANTVKMPCNQLLIIALDTGQMKCCVLHQTLTEPQHDEKERMCTALRLPSA